MNHQEQLTRELAAEWSLELHSIPDRVQLLQLLETRVSQLIAENPEQLLQHMYRMDISEQALRQALDTPEAPGEIAELIYERQLQRLKDRDSYSRPEDIPPDLEW